MRPSRPRHLAANASQNVGAAAAMALTASLMNPYGQYNAVNAYYHPLQYPRHATAEGYSYSSTYSPYHAGIRSDAYAPLPEPQTFEMPPRPERLSSRNPLAHSNSPIPPRPKPHGPIRCDYPQCTFSGTAKVVEIHKMDRHLIYPPSWKPVSNWDADPSLRGKPVAILGTGVVLDSQEKINQWIEERKKKWPSAGRVEEKRRMRAEAIERGELLQSNATRSLKRAREDDFKTAPSFSRKFQRRPANIQRRFPEAKPPAVVEQTTTATSSPLSSSNKVQQEERQSSEDESSGSDVDPILDAISSKKTDMPSSTDDVGPEALVQTEQERPPTSGTLRGPKHSMYSQTRRKVEPKPLPPTAFSSHASLLRNLLLPDIRVTVSNLSQAIHFLVDNDFLDNVELHPGDIQRQRIRVITQESATDEHVQNTDQSPS